MCFQLVEELSPDIVFALGTGTNHNVSDGTGKQANRPILTIDLFLLWAICACCSYQTSQL